MEGPAVVDVSWWVETAMTGGVRTVRNPYSEIRKTAIDQIHASLELEYIKRRIQSLEQRPIKRRVT